MIEGGEMEIEIKGTIIPNDYAEIYEYLGMSYTAPKDINLPENNEDVEVYINSYGGDVYSGSQIYTMLKDYDGKVTTIITGLAASMASVIAMAGDVVKISPVGSLMIHNVSTYAEGDKKVMTKEAETLHGFDKTLTNAYRLKTGLDQEELLGLMDKETWLTPSEALEKGFVDEILFNDKEVPLLVAGPEMLSKEIIDKTRKVIAMEKNKKENLRNVEEAEETEEEKEEVEEEKTETEEVEETTEEEQEEQEEKKETNKVPNHFSNDMNIKPMENKAPFFKNEADPTTLKVMGGMNMNEKNNYKNAFLNAIRGNKLSQEEVEVLATKNKSFVDAFTHDTTNTSIVIPRETQDRIWSRAIAGYGVLEDVNRLSVHGELRMVKHSAIEAGDAKWYVEANATEDEKNKFSELVLKGHELSKAVTVSWKLRAMAMEDFENFLVKEIADRISIALGTAVTQGTGTDEPTGIITALKDKKEQKVAVAKAGVLTYEELLKAIAKVHSSYKAGAKIYANSTVIWTVLANVVDGNGRPFFEVTSTGEGVGNALGFTVKEDASLKDDEIIIGNPAQGYVFNVNEEMSMTTEDHAKARTTDFVAYMIADGNVIDEQAFALLSLKQTV